MIFGHISVNGALEHICLLELKRALKDTPIFVLDAKCSRLKPISYLWSNRRKMLQREEKNAVISS